MATILIDIGEIHLRVRAVRKLLRPLRKGRDVGCYIGRGISPGDRVVCAHDGLTGTLDFREWRFRSFVREIWCQYFELWRPYKDNLRLFLDRAYLTLFLVDRGTHQLYEFLCIHCDPDAEDEEPLRTYKRGPHLHIKKADNPLPNSHFPLNLGHLEEVLISAGSLTSAIQDAVIVVSDEVLARYR